MTMLRKPIFLDIDGPMVSARTLMLPENGWRKFGWQFDPAAVHMLNFLMWADPEVCLVLSSHRWGDHIAQRCHGVRSPYPHEFPDLCEKEFWIYHFKQQNLNTRFHDDWITVREMKKRTYIKRPKYLEISDWLRLHPEVKQFVTLEDDLNGGGEVKNEMRKRFHLVAEYYDDGFTWQDFRKAAMYLGVNLSSDKYREYNEYLLSESVV